MERQRGRIYGEGTFIYLYPFTGGSVFETTIPPVISSSGHK